MAHGVPRRPGGLRHVRHGCPALRPRPRQLNSGAGQPRGRDSVGSSRSRARRLLARNRRPASRPRRAGASSRSSAMDARAARARTSAGSDARPALRKRCLFAAHRWRSVRPDLRRQCKGERPPPSRRGVDSLGPDERPQPIHLSAGAPAALVGQHREPASRLWSQAPWRPRARGLPLRQGDQLRWRLQSFAPKISPPDAYRGHRGPSWRLSFKCMPEVLTQRSDGPPLPALAHTPPARTESTGKAMITSTQIARRVHEMGREISRVYSGIDSPLVLVVILKGATVFAADLLRSLSVPAELEFVRAASYGSGTTRGPLRLAHMMDGPLVDRHVLLVEDIVDSGHTVEAITRRVKRMKPASLRLAALLDRPARRAVRVEIDFKGFVIPDRFVIGYGLDYAGLYRELPGIYSLG